MGSGQPLTDDATLPPYASRQGAICPRCHRELVQATAAYETYGPNAIPRCPEHGLAFIDAQELAESGGDPMLGAKVAGRFTVLSRLGAGSMGAVYRARQETVGRDVAIKIVRRERAYDAETKARFEREARATSQLVSPHTVTVFDFGEAEDGSWFLAMELLNGETLGDRLRRMGRLGVHDAVRITKEALKSLAEAHGKGIVHRDLKPDNVFLTELPGEVGAVPGEMVKVLDFGIAKLVRDEKRVDQLETQAGTVFGTPRYMSPEQAQGNPLDARSDLYSLGVILYQMLCGRCPFVDDDAVVVMARHIKDTPPMFVEVSPDLVRIPPSVEAVVRRSIAKYPDDRPSSAEVFAAELDAALEQAGVLASGVHSTSWAAPTNTIRTVVPRPHRPLLIGLGLFAALVLFVGGFFAVRAVVSSQSVASDVASVPPASAPPAVELSTLEPPSAAEPEPEPAASAAPSAEVSGDGTPPRRRATRPRFTARPAAKPPTKAAPPPSEPAPPSTSSPYGRFE